MTTKACSLQRLRITSESSDEIAVISLDRPEKANAFNAALIKDLTETFNELHRKPVRLAILRGKGRHFSAGADLEWMQAAAKLNYEENIKDSTDLRAMFAAYACLPFPTIAVAQGAVYGGAVGLLAASDIVIADASAKFSLSEAKLGLLPAVIYPYLMMRISAAPLKRWGMTATVWTAEEALHEHLVDVVDADFWSALGSEINQLLSCSPDAQARLKNLHEKVRSFATDVPEESIKAIAELRTSLSGQAGLAAFFAKTPPPWAMSFDIEKLKDLWL